MWTHIVATLVLLIVATWVIEWFLARRHARKTPARNVVTRDVAPVVGFLGVILLALSLAEAARSAVLAAWGWGIALGVIASAYAVLAVRATVAAQPTQSPARAAWRLLRTRGVALLLALAGVYLAVRVVGAALEVLLAGALGVMVVAMAVLSVSRKQ